MFGNLIIGGVVGAVIDHSSGTAYEYPEIVKVVMGQFTTLQLPPGPAPAQAQPQAQAQQAQAKAPPPQSAPTAAAAPAAPAPSAPPPVTQVAAPVAPDAPSQVVRVVSPGYAAAPVTESIQPKVPKVHARQVPPSSDFATTNDADAVPVRGEGRARYLHYLTRGNKDLEGYSSISITDPGNSEAVITVGSTHREKAHAYGVSFFSSRGPTGDGRIKPDLVAPGEKIVSAIPGKGMKPLDGTSMAAPHVSGAAALLIGRYSELIGRPQRIKEILCSTATDLGRERYFQGHGMLDVLRAMQSI
jgi:subtilisin family serine protease